MSQIALTFLIVALAQRSLSIPHSFPCPASSALHCTTANVAQCACRAVDALASNYASDLFDSWTSSTWITAVGVEALTNYQLRSFPNASAISLSVDAVLGRYDYTYLQLADSGSYDDLLWWSLAWLRHYEATRQVASLQQAQKIFDSVYQLSWDNTTCGGGFWWSMRYNYKNAITNELGITASAKLHEYLQNSTTRYGRIADQSLKWFLSSNMLNAEHLINDGLFKSNCTNNGDPTWTYNQGVVLMGLALAAKRQNHPPYLNVAAQIVDAVIARLTTNSGVLQEPLPKHPWNDNDQFAFKGIFVRYLSYLIEVEPTASPQVPKWKKWIKQQQMSLITSDRSTQNLFGNFWQGPFGATYNNVSAATQISAIDLLTALY